MVEKNNHKLEGWNTSMNELRICWKNVNLARGAAEAVTRWTDAVTQLAGFVICQTCALPIWTQFRVAFALSLQKHDELAVVDACCLKHLKYNKQIKIKKSLNPYFTLHRPVVWSSIGTTSVGAAGATMRGQGRWRAVFLLCSAAQHYIEVSGSCIL